MGRFAAMDFETADHGRDSACSVAIIVVEGTTVVDRGHFLIRPPRQHIVFSYLHGITWNHVREQPTFGELWPTAGKLLAGVEFIAAHSAAFDRGVLYTCCAAANLPRPDHPFYCTVQMARKAWGLKPAKLPNVASFLGLPLKHHDAESDALACAGIVIAARQQGHPLTGRLNPARY